MPTPQDRANIDLPILHHARQPASSLIAIAMRAVTVSEAFTRQDQQINADATSAPVAMLLPPGDEAWIGLRLAVVKTDASANAVSIARSGTNTIEGETSLSTTTQHDRLEVYWDGSTWRRSTTGAGGGTFTAPSIVETTAVKTKDADTDFDLAAGDRTLLISTTGAGTRAINAVDTGEPNQDVHIRMTGAVTGTYELALAGGLTATFSSAGDSLHIRHEGGGVWAAYGGTAVVA